MISFVILMQIIYYSMDRMFFSDTYFTWGFDDKIEKNIEPWWEFHSGPACCSVKLWKLSSKFFVQFSGLVCQYFKILIYAILWRYVFDYWCFDGIVELVVATCWMDFLVHAMDSDVNPRSYEHIWLVKAPGWIQCPGCLGQAVVTLRLPFMIVESPQSHKHVPFVNIASLCSRSIKRHQSPYDFETWKLYPTGYTYHLIKFWRNSVGNFFLTFFVSFFFLQNFRCAFSRSNNRARH